MTKRITPPQNLDKKGGGAFRRRRRPRSPSNRPQIQTYSVCRATWAPPNHAEFFFFVLECIAGETRVIKSVYPAVFTKFRKYPFLTRFNPFLARCDLVCPGLAQKHRRFATVSARGCRGATNRLRPTSKGSTTHTRSNLISIRDQHSTGLGSVITAYHDET